jgi:hypothetical protein
MSSPLGYNTIEQFAMASLVLSVAWAVAVIFIAPSDWIPIFAIPPPACVFVYLTLANFLNRTRLNISATGIVRRVGPIPVPGQLANRSLTARQITAIFVSPFAIPNRYTPTFIHTFDVLALTSDGEAVCLLNRIRKLADANELAGSIRRQLGPLTTAPPPLAAPTRSVSLDQNVIADGWPTLLVFSALLLAGLIIIAAPWLFTAGKPQAIATITEVGHTWVSGARRSYRKQTCYVEYATPQGRETAELKEDCPNPSQRGDQLIVYYDLEKPNRPMVRAHWKWPFGLVYCLIGIGGLIYQASSRRRTSTTLLEDPFRRLDPYWDLSSKTASAAKGILQLKGQPGDNLGPLLHQKAFSSPSIELQVHGQAGGGSGRAGIKFWADGTGASHVFVVLPFEGAVEAWRVAPGGHVDWVLPLTRLPQIVRRPGEWNSLAVVTRGNQADLMVNTVRAATITGNSPPGGSLAGIFAEFPLGAAPSTWEFSQFRVF